MSRVSAVEEERDLVAGEVPPLEWLWAVAMRDALRSPKDSLPTPSYRLSASDLVLSPLWVLVRPAPEVPFRITGKLAWFYPILACPVHLVLPELGALPLQGRPWQGRFSRQLLEELALCEGVSVRAMLMDLRTGGREMP